MHYMLSPDRLVNRDLFVCLCICSACVTSPSAPFQRGVTDTPGLLSGEPVAGSKRLERPSGISE